MNRKKIQPWIGPLFVLIIFALFHYKNKVIKEQKIEQMNKVLGFTLKEISDEINLKHRHHKNIVHKNLNHLSQWLTAFGASVAVADINNDGYQDVFLNDSSPNSVHSLLVNTKSNHFEDQTKEFGLDKMSYPYAVTKSIFFDCNNDGYQDLFLLSQCPQLFINHDGKYFEDYSAKSGVQKCTMVGAAANVFDYDKDGNLDLIWALISLQIL